MYKNCNFCNHQLLPITLYYMLYKQNFKTGHKAQDHAACLGPVGANL